MEFKEIVIGNSTNSGGGFFVSSEASFGRLLVTVIASLVEFVVFFVLFTVLRNLKLSEHYFNFQYFLAPRTFSPKFVGPVYTNRFRWVLLWWFDTLMYPTENLIDSHGFDALMYLKFLKVSLVTMMYFSVISLVVLLPTYLIGNGDSGPFDLTYFSLSSLE